MQVIACDPYLEEKTIAARGAIKVSLDELLRRADFVSINCPLDEETRGMIGTREFALMQPHAYFITTARGFIHDERALAEALRSKKIAGAGVDVWDKEPPAADHPLLGDARLVLRQFIEALKSQGGRPPGRESVSAELERVRSAWLAEWAPTLGSKDVPINPYRVISEFMRTVDPRDAIVTHDSGSPRDQLLPFYRAVSPRSYLGWGKSHALGTGLGLVIGAKLAAPDKLCVNFMGDAAFGMTGLDFETAVRCGIPILTVVLNNSAMAIEIPHLVVSHDKYGARDIGGRYADLGRAMGGWSERVEKPDDIAGAFTRARKATENGQAALLEFITSQETRFSNRGALR